MPYYDIERLVVIDNSDLMIRAGLGSDEAPQADFPAVVGRPQHSGAKVGWNHQDYYCGDDALAKRGILNLSYPAEFGLIKNWGDIEKLWHHTFFNVLKVPPEEYGIVLTEAPLTPEMDREKVVAMMFDTFNAAALYIAVDAALALYAAGRKTGLVLQSTESKTQAVPVINGKVISPAVVTLDMGGRNVVEYFVQLLTERGYSLTSTAYRDAARHMVEECGYVALDFNNELARARSPGVLDKQYELPDGEPITIGSERFRATEVLFKPDMIGKAQSGIARMVVESIAKCDASVRNTLYSNIVLAGSNTTFAGIAERLTKEISTIAPPPTKFNVVALPDRTNLTWIGGALLSKSAPICDMLICKQQYDNSGPSVGRLCSGL